MQNLRCFGHLHLNLFDLNHEFLVFCDGLNGVRKMLYVFSRDNFKFLYKHFADMVTLVYMHEELGFDLLEFGANKIRIFNATQTGFRMLGITVQVDNHMDLIRLFLNNDYFRVTDERNCCIQKIF
jgi:hypothetical protein